MTAAFLGNAPYRAEHVGSFVRPDSLLTAVRAAKAGKIGDDELQAAQDQAIRDVVSFQESIGLPSATDGEFRRRAWSAGFIDAVSGFGLREEGVLGFRTEEGELGLAASPYAAGRLARKGPIVTEDFKFLKSAVTTATPKVTMPSPPVLHFFLGPRSVDEAAYPDIEDYYADLAQIYRDEIADLAEAGCAYLQLDDTASPCNCDARAREGVRARGEDPDALSARYVELINHAIGSRPPDMKVATHMCRGNLKGAWMAEGGYEAIAETVFGGLDVDGYLLEYDTPRAGDFDPLRFVPKGKRVVLGLISTKTPELEDPDDLKRRIDEAAKFIPLDQLGVGPQCGFSSVGGSGHLVDADGTRRKLELMMRVVEEVWG